MESEDRLRLLMIRSLNGDAPAYRQLLCELSRYLRGYFACRAGGGDVEDLVQETLLLLHLKRDSYDRELPFAHWAGAIARYKLTEHLRRNHPWRVPAADTGDLFATQSPEEGAVRSDVTRLLARLSKRSRTAPSTRNMLRRSLKWLTQAVGAEGR